MQQTLLFISDSGALKGPFTSSTGSRFGARGPACVSRGNTGIYVLVLLARAEGQGRSVAARGDKRSKMAQCLALCSALNCLAAAREP